MTVQVPRLKDKDTQRAIQEVLDRLLLLEESSGSQVGNPKQTEGIPGAVRVVKKSDGSTVLQIRSKEGWFDSGPIDFQDKEE
jgi:hypothetical protein